ncbi:MAG: UV DNA damage repair endonuclease UvsE [Parachlamydiales bacterium]
MIRLGLCCLFRSVEIPFQTATATYTAKLKEPLAYLSARALNNAQSLKRAFEYCVEQGIGDFRICSDLLPLCSHPALGYEIEALPDGEAILELFGRCKRFAREHDLRLTFHPDQFVVLSSPRREVVENSLREMEMHGELAELVGADVINIHAGGTYGNKGEALERLERNLERLSEQVRSRLTLENDDRSYTPSDLLPFCKRLHIPFCYDVHHHRCLPDGLTVEEATEAALERWDREPLFHVSSPKNGWGGGDPKPHHEELFIRDFPECWREIPKLTVEVEAKGKELALFKLAEQLKKRGYIAGSGGRG